jgi:hypothetical protein
VASRLAAKAISLWRCKGFKGEDAFARWHITSTDIHEASFPLLNSVISRGFSYAVAFHGFDDPEIPFDILIGGAAPVYLKQDIETAIKGAIAGSDLTVHIASPDEKFGGDSLKNIVNRLTAGGEKEISNSAPSQTAKRALAHLCEFQPPCALESDWRSRRRSNSVRPETLVRWHQAGFRWYGPMSTYQQDRWLRRARFRRRRRGPASR